MKSDSDKKTSIFQIQSFKNLYGGITERWFTFLSSSEPEKETKSEKRLSFFEYLLTKAFRKQPPPPPPPPPSLLEKLWNAIKWEGIELTREVVSSSAASVGSVLFTQPLEVLKTHYFTAAHALNTQQKGRRYFANGLRFYNEVRRLYRMGGIAKFYQGHVFSQKESLFQTVSMFYTQQRVYHQLEVEGLHNYPNLCSFISGFLSATIAVIALKPLEAYREQRRRRQMLLERYGPINAAYELKKRSNFRSLFHGCFPEFMFLGTQYGLRFWLYNEIRDYILDRKTKVNKQERKRLDPNADLDHYRKEDTVRHLNYAESLFAGAASGIVADLVSHPLEVIATRLHMGTLHRQLYRFEDTCRRYHQCIWLLLRKHKIKGLYAGFTPSLIKSMTCVAVQFAVYDKVVQWLEPFFGEKVKKSKKSSENEDIDIEI